jgi:hypothetical protein
MTIKQRTKNMNKLIKFMRKYPHSFNMGCVASIVPTAENNHIRFAILNFYSVHEAISTSACGAACCIIGYTNAVTNDGTSASRWTHVHEFLGVSGEAETELCYPALGTRFYPELSYDTKDVEVGIKFIKQVCEEQNDLQRVRSANSRRT